MNKITVEMSQAEFEFQQFLKTSLRDSGGANYRTRVTMTQGRYGDMLKVTVSKIFDKNAIIRD